MNLGLRRKGLASIAVLAVAIASGCSITPEKTARPLDDNYRITLDSKATPSVQTPTEAAIIYLVQGPDLIRRTRVAVGPLTPVSVLDIVANGPTDGERDSGIRSALGSTPLVIDSISSTDTTMILDLATGFAELPGEEQMLLIGQIVLSMFENFSVRSISVTLAGQPTAVLGPEGNLIERPILPSDYRPLVLNLR